MGRKGAQSSFVASVTALRTVVSCLTDMDIREPDIRSCGDNMVNVFDTDEEHFAVSSSSAADTAFDGVIGCIEDIIMEDDFQQLQQIFMEKHYCEFDDSDENKLSYTPIFNEYIDLLEKYLEQQLMERIPGFNMDTFKELLMQHKEEVSGDIFDMLLTFTDFMAFKEMFLQYRAEKEGQCPDLSQGLVVTSLNLGGSKHADFNESQ
ncbi:ADP-ribosylation factor-like protein 2-binding protein isoform X1 [Oreochromis aureus]|uniref:ADP-ribosylation factor-like protein 2-binding protein n=2 Tax=Oreochromis aureus TaxID=47969 RepID=A0AAZ1X7Q5_OREAU|nr:ADP-ribosylation factor-like protein 2-binding protein isoform X1 [Oreochromis aureus]